MTRLDGTDPADSVALHVLNQDGIGVRSPLDYLEEEGRPGGP